MTVMALGAGPREPEDPYLWLEDVESERALAWVEERNQESREALEALSGFAPLEQRLRAIFDSDERIPGVRKIGPLYYNFWRDRAHPRGIWRRTTLESYATAEPGWETVLDLDALANEEAESWVWGGAQCLRPGASRCLISLSRGGGDAHVVREFDLEAGAFVADGFVLPEGKHRTAWRDHDHLYLGTDFGAGSLTESGYPRTARLWKRGTPWAEATLVYEGEPGDVSVSAYRDLTPGFERDFVVRAPTFFSSELYWLREGERVAIEKPADAGAFAHRDWLLVRLRTPWTVGEQTYPAGSLLAARFEDWVAGKRELTVLFEPGERQSLAGLATTRHHVVLDLLDNVRGRIEVLTPNEGGFARTQLRGLPELGSVAAWAVESSESDAVFVSSTDFLTPTTLYLGQAGSDAAPRPLKQLPALFDPAGLASTQHEARSADGTRIPYFMVGPATHGEASDAPEPRPTLLTGYGGFEVSRLPAYSASVGAAWLERGGVYVVANIRGGGEFGPSWHQAALREKRSKAYDDFIAVAEDLIARGVTTRERLGIMGGSNGGLLVGNMLTRRPDLFGAVVCQAPLLDMRRYHKLLAGASWMAEYGDPDDPDDWAFLRSYSPYHQVAKEVAYPPVLFLTSTRDDRVHPGHARKMAARMRAQGHRLLYYENTEGGHAGAANNAQQARMSALAMSFLWHELEPD